MSDSSDDESVEDMGEDESEDSDDTEKADPKTVISTTPTSRPAEKSKKNKSDFISFEAQTVKEANVYAISHVRSDTRARVELYINEAMQKDHMYVEKLYGRVNPSINRDYDYFWESPWVEEHIHDSNKKRRMDEQNRNYAYRNFIRASADNKKTSLKRTLQAMQEFDDMSRKDYVRTVSRVVQSFESKAIQRVIQVIGPGGLKRHIALHHLNRMCNSPVGSNTVVGDMTTAANTLRRNPITRDLLIGLVTAELLLANINGGGQIAVIHQSKFLQSERDSATVQMLNALQACTEDQLPLDTIGLPLMEVNSNICVRHGVLVVQQNREQPMYVMVLKGDGANTQSLEGVKQIRIKNQIIDEALDDDIEQERVTHRLPAGVTARQALRHSEE